MTICWIAALLVVTSLSAVAAQGPGGSGGPPGPPATPRAAAPFDLTGTWVSVVTEDWRWRMWTPPKGDYTSVPLNAEGRKVADGWNLEADNQAQQQCKAYGAPAIMRQPTRLRISWQDEQTLRIETDAGEQTRVLRFGPFTAPAGDRGWQGHTIAEWSKQAQSQGLGAFGRGRGGFAGGNLKAVTTHLRAGYLRKNGVPYSEDARVTEYFNRHAGPGSLEWFTVTTIVEDPRYLTSPFITSSSFRREPDDAKFQPTPCQTARPTIDKPRVGEQFPI